MPDETSFRLIVDHLLQSNYDFDHPDIDELGRLAQSKGLDPIEGGRALIVARERKGLIEAEIVDGGDGSIAKQVNTLGADSISEMLFSNTRARPNLG